MAPARRATFGGRGSARRPPPVPAQIRHVLPVCLAVAARRRLPGGARVRRAPAVRRGDLRGVLHEVNDMPSLVNDMPSLVNDMPSLVNDMPSLVNTPPCRRSMPRMLRPTSSLLLFCLCVLGLVFSEHRMLRLTRALVAGLVCRSFSAATGHISCCLTGNSRTRSCTPRYGRQANSSRRLAGWPSGP